MACMVMDMDMAMDMDMDMDMDTWSHEVFGCGQLCLVRVLGGGAKGVCPLC